MLSYGLQYKLFPPAWNLFHPAQFQTFSGKHLVTNGSNQNEALGGSLDRKRFKMNSISLREKKLELILTRVITTFT